MVCEGVRQRRARIGLILAELLRGQRTDYVLSSEALTYMSEQKLPSVFVAASEPVD